MVVLIHWYIQSKTKVRYSLQKSSQNLHCRKNQEGRLLWPKEKMKSNMWEDSALECSVCWPDSISWSLPWSFLVSCFCDFLHLQALQPPCIIKCDGRGGWLLSPRNLRVHCLSDLPGSMEIVFSAFCSWNIMLNDNKVSLQVRPLWESIGLNHASKAQRLSWLGT